MNRARQAFLRAIAALRTAWDIFGVTLVLLLVGLGAMGLAGRIFRPSPPPGAAPYPYATEPWYHEFAAEEAATLRMRWTPYTHWHRRPFAGRWVNVDSAGFRVVPQPVSDSAARRQVWFFGGSTMWGTGQRDSATIPAVVARVLDSMGLQGVSVRNLGETGYVSTQGLVRLLLELRDGHRPDVVVFYDGINDAAASAMNGRCGWPQNEGRRGVEFAIGRFLVARGRTELGDLLAAMRGQARLEGGVKPLRDLQETPELRAVGHGIVDCYARNAGLIDALGREFGFHALYFWQPTPSSAPKPLTAFERAVTDSTRLGGLHPYLWVLNRIAAREIDSAMTPLVGARFRSLSGVFAGDSGAVWLDYVGHLTERANSKVAAAMVGPVVRALESGPPPR